MSKTAQNIERLGQMLQLLRAGRTTGQIADIMKARGYDVSRRTVQRYIEDLRSIGVGLEWNRDAERFDVYVTDYTRSLLAVFMK